MKGIILAGGTGSRLYPMTRAVSKQLLPIYDKPMIYYPLSVLMLAGIRQILVITTPHDRDQFERLLGDGSQWGIQITYAVQDKPEGLPQALIIGQDFIADDNVALILGDNFFYGQGFRSLLRKTAERTTGATIFCYQVANPERYGVIEFDSQLQPISVEEKPKQPKSKLAITGLYFFDNRATQFATELKPSRRNELEITDLIRRYLEHRELHVEQFSRGFAWMDMGTKDSLLDACNFVAAIEHRQGLKISCLEEIALSNGFANPDVLMQQAMQHNNDYCQYISNLFTRHEPKPVRP